MKASKPNTAFYISAVEPGPLECVFLLRVNQRQRDPQASKRVPGPGEPEGERKQTETKEITHLTRLDFPNIPCPPGSPAPSLQKYDTTPTTIFS